MVKNNSFWKPVKLNKSKPKLFAPVNLKKYPPRTKAETRLIDRKPFGDKDKDGVLNFFDCKPLNKKFQDVILYHGTTPKAAQQIKKEGLRTGHGINPYIYLTPKKEIARRYANEKGIVFQVKLSDEFAKKQGIPLKNPPTEVTITSNVPANKLKELNDKSYPVRTAQENQLIDKNPFGDTDKDGVMNMLDCKPLDRKQQSKMLREDIQKRLKIKTYAPKEYYSKFKNDKTKIITEKDIVKFFEKRPQLIKKAETSAWKIAPTEKGVEPFGSGPLGIFKVDEDSPIPTITLHPIEDIDLNTNFIIAHELGHSQIFADEKLNREVRKLNLKYYNNILKELKDKKLKGEPISKELMNYQDKLPSERLADQYAVVDINKQKEIEKPETLGSMIKRGNVPSEHVNIPLEEAKFVSLYHGTQKKAVPRILKEGLKPIVPRKPWYDATYQIEGRTVSRKEYKKFIEEEGYVFLTPSKSAAIIHADYGPEIKRKGLAGMKHDYESIAESLEVELDKNAWIIGSNKRALKSKNFKDNFIKENLRKLQLERKGIKNQIAYNKELLKKEKIFSGKGAVLKVTLPADIVRRASPTTMITSAVFQEEYEIPLTKKQLKGAKIEEIPEKKVTQKALTQAEFPEVVPTPTTLKYAIDDDVTVDTPTTLYVPTRRKYPSLIKEESLKYFEEANLGIDPEVDKMINRMDIEGMLQDEEIIKQDEKMGNFVDVNDNIDKEWEESQKEPTAQELIDEA